MILEWARPQSTAYTIALLRPVAATTRATRSPWVCRFRRWGSLSSIFGNCLHIDTLPLRQRLPIDCVALHGVVAGVKLRPYEFLASILPYNNASWEKLSILLAFLIPKLPAPIDEDLSKGILEAIDMDSYRAEKKAAMRIGLPDADAEIGPVPTSGGGRKPEPELDRLSNILKSFNEHFGTLFSDGDRVAKRITDEIAPKVAADQGYQNAKKNTPNTARLEHDKALGRIMVSLLKDDTELYKQFVQNESFKRFVTDMVYTLTAD
jgi:type I restriction enzyme R subunit